MIIGLTGSIGMGKSAVAKMLRQEGIAVFDADEEVHILQGPGGRLVPAIEAAFPGTTDHRGVDRQKLGAQVFGDAHALKKLEHIVHPAVFKSRITFLKRNRARKIIVFDIPLLFEKQGDRKVDAVLVVSAAPWQQRKRVLARPNMTYGKFRYIKSLQTPDPEKRRRADYVIHTGTTLHKTRQSVRRLVYNLRSTLA
jgi:dephospho-CoA kinase